MIIDNSISYGEQLGLLFATGLPWIIIGVTFVAFPLVHAFVGMYELAANLIIGFVQAAFFSAAAILLAPLFMGEPLGLAKVAIQVNEGYGLEEESGWVTAGDVRELYAKPGEVVNLSLVDTEKGNGSSGGMLFGVFDESEKQVTLYRSNTGEVDVDDLVELELVK